MKKKLLLTLMFFGAAQMALAGVTTFEGLSFADNTTEIWKDGLFIGDGLNTFYREDDNPSVMWVNFLVVRDSTNTYVLNGGTLAAGQLGTFDFLAADFRAVGGFSAADSILFTGVGESGAFSGEIDLTASFEPTTILNLRNLSSVMFTPMVETLEGLRPGGTFHMDNIELYDGGQGPVIPVPGAIVLGGIGTLCVGWLRRRRAF